MKLLTLAAVGLLILSAAPEASAQGAAPSGPATAADSGFRAFLREFEAATTDFLNGDARAWIANASHADDVTLFSPFGQAGTGWAQVGPMYTRGASRLRPRGAKLSVEYLAVIVTGEQAYTVGIERKTFQVAATDSTVHDVTRATDIFRREAGHWKLVHRHMDHLTPPT